MQPTDRTPAQEAARLLAAAQRTLARADATESQLDDAHTAAETARDLYQGAADDTDDEQRADHLADRADTADEIAGRIEERISALDTDGQTVDQPDDPLDRASRAMLDSLRAQADADAQRARIDAERDALIAASIDPTRTHLPDSALGRTCDRAPEVLLDPTTADKVARLEAVAATFAAKADAEAAMPNPSKARLAYYRANARQTARMAADTLARTRTALDLPTARHTDPLPDALLRPYGHLLGVGPRIGLQILRESLTADPQESRAAAWLMAQRQCGQASAYAHLQRARFALCADPEILAVVGALAIYPQGDAPEQQTTADGHWDDSSGDGEHGVRHADWQTYADGTARTLNSPTCNRERAGLLRQREQQRHLGLESYVSGTREQAAARLLAIGEPLPMMGDDERTQLALDNAQAALAHFMRDHDDPADLATPDHATAALARLERRQTHDANAQANVTLLRGYERSRARFRLADLIGQHGDTLGRGLMTAELAAKATYQTAYDDAAKWITDPEPTDKDVRKAHRELAPPAAQAVYDARDTASKAAGRESTLHRRLTLLRRAAAWQCQTEYLAHRTDDKHPITYTRRQRTDAELTAAKHKAAEQAVAVAVDLKIATVDAENADRNLQEATETYLGACHDHASRNADRCRDRWTACTTLDDGQELPAAGSVDWTATIGVSMKRAPAAAKQPPEPTLDERLLQESTSGSVAGSAQLGTFTALSEQYERALDNHNRAGKIKDPEARERAMDRWQAEVDDLRHQLEMAEEALRNRAAQAA